jgi:peptidoglycan-N-acetylglucosamine deacetylase
MRLLVAMLGLLTAVALAQPQVPPARSLAITFDDLPRGGDSREGRNLAAILEMTRKLMDGCEGIPISGFVNRGRAEISDADLDAVLQLWAAQGAELGNHTASHPDFNNTPLAAYTQDILALEPVLRRARGGKRSLYFRHPFLHTGKTESDKAGLAAFLAEQRYVVAPVSVDTADYLVANVYAYALRNDAAFAKRVREAYVPYLESVFAFFEERSREVVGREIPQIILLHANQLNADTMPEMLSMLKRRGYAIVTLDQALKDTAYALPDSYVGTNGISWIHRWAHTKGMPQRWEPDPPKWILDAYYERNPRH